MQLNQLIEVLSKTQHPKPLLELLSQYFQATSGSIAWIDIPRQELNLLASLGQPRIIAHSLSLEVRFEKQNPLAAILNDPDHHQFSDTSAICVWWRDGELLGLLALEELAQPLAPSECLPLMEYVGDQLYIQELHRRSQNLTAQLQHLTTFHPEKQLRDLAQGFREMRSPLEKIFAVEKSYWLSIRQIGEQFTIQTCDPALDDSQLIDWDIFIQRSLQKNRLIYPRLGDATFPEEEILLESLGFKSALIIPIRSERQVWGAFILGEDSYARHFTEEEQMLAQNLRQQTLTWAEQLQQIQDLQEVSGIKSNVIRMASHDLRNPLSQINSYLEQLSQSISTPTEQQTNYLARLGQNIERLTEQLNNLLNTEQFEAPAQNAWEEVKLYPIFEQAYMSLYDQARRKKLEYVIKISPRLPMVWGNAIELEHACWNLIHNAIKYTPEGGKVAVTVEVTAKKVFFRVEDTGYGIPEEKQAPLFSRFYRAKAPGTEHISGTGLGLNLVKTIVERHHGEISFESHFGQGSRFEFWLPLSHNE